MMKTPMGVQAPHLAADHAGFLVRLAWTLRH